jgi:hypothetical protein
MTRSVLLPLTLLTVPLLMIGCGDSGSDGYHEVTAAVESLPTTAEIDNSAHNDAAVEASASRAETRPDEPGNSEPGNSEPGNSEPGTAPDAAGDAVASGSAGDRETADPEPETSASAPGKSANVGDDDDGQGSPAGEPASADQPAEEKPQREIKLLIPSKTFKAEGPEKALRVSFDDVDLLKVLNMDPVIPTARELMPDWLKQLDGKRIRIRGFMIPPFSETDVRAFTLARDTQLCCFGRNPLPYDLIDVFLREGAATEYIELRPFDVIGVFHIGDEIEPGYLYSIDDAVVIQ